MRLGFITSILDGWTYDEMMGVAGDLGFSCVEVASWPQGAAERRYAGVSHIDAERVLADGAYARALLDRAKETGVRICSLAYYPNPLDPDPSRRAAVLSHLEATIRAAAALGVPRVTTFIGRDQTKTVEDNLKLVAEVWPPLMRVAEREGVSVAIENCPMLFGPDQWPGGQNLMTTPEIWRQVFEAVPSDRLGLNYDPSHFVWQMMDYLAPIAEFSDKIFQVHFKDIKLLPERLERVGTMAYPLSYMTPKIPGLGDVDWGAFVSALTDAGFDGDACIEIEDRAFEGSRERVLDSLRLSKRYVNQFVI